MDKLDDIKSYEVLGLEYGATKAQVDSAYRKLSKQWHPDNFARDQKRCDEATEKIKGINNARDFFRNYKFGIANHPPPRGQPTQTEQKKQRSEEAEQRKREGERQNQEAEAAYRREQVARAQEQAKRQEAERQQKERLEREWLEKERLKRATERLRIHKEKEAVNRREQSAQVHENTHPKKHYFYQGKCLGCGRSKATLAFYPDLPCL